MIDAAIPLAGQPAQVTSPLSLLNQVGNLQQQQQNLQTGAIKQQGDQLTVNQQQQSAQDQADYRAAMAAGTKLDPATGQPTLDRPTMLATLAKLNPTAAAQTATNLNQQDTAAQEAKAKLTSAQAAAVTAHLDLKDKLLQNVTDEPSYQNARTIAIQNGINPAEMPPHFDPQWVAQTHAQTLTQQQQFQQQQEAQKAQETERHNKAEELAASGKAEAKTLLLPGGQQVAGKVDTHGNLLLANGSPAPAGAKLYQQPNFGSIALQMPQVVFDPSTGQNVYTTRAGAIGKEAPSSGDALAAKAGVQADAASLKKLQTNFDQTQAFENTALKNMNLLQQTAQKIPDLGAKFANTPVRMISTSMIGTDNMASFKTALATAQTEAAKVLNSSNASGVLSDSARHELQSIIDGNMPLSAMVASLNTLKQDMGNRTQAYQQQIGEIQTRLNKGTQPPAQQAPPASSANPQTHVFSVSAWQKANPQGDANAAKAAAQQQGYQVNP